MFAVLFVGIFDKWYVIGLRGWVLEVSCYLELDKAQNSLYNAYFTFDDGINVLFGYLETHFLKNSSEIREKLNLLLSIECCPVILLLNDTAGTHIVVYFNDARNEMSNYFSHQYYCIRLYG